MAKLQAGSRIYGNATVDGTLAMGSSFRRNRIINGNMAVSQRNGSSNQTITAAAALAYTADRWYAWCTGANVTGARVANIGTLASPAQYAYQFTGAASVTAINFAQRIEAVNCYDLAGTTATLSVTMSNSLLTSVTWTAYYANTTDTFGTIASPTVTQIASGGFNVTSAPTTFTAQIPIPIAATTGIQIVFSVGAQTSGTWIIGNVQLEAGTTATPYERIPYSEQLTQCQRYCQARLGSQGSNGTNVQLGYGNARSTSSVSAQDRLQVQMRIAPSLTVVGATGFYVYSQNTPGQIATTALAYDISDPYTMLLTATTAAVLTAAQFYTLGIASATSQVIYSAEL